MITMLGLLMLIDVAAVGIVVLGAVIILQRDLQEANWLIRLAMVMLIAAGGWHMTWLLGDWEPSASGFPVPRLLFDWSLAMLVIARVLFPIGKNASVSWVEHKRQIFAAALDVPFGKRDVGRREETNVTRFQQARIR